MRLSALVPQWRNGLWLMLPILAFNLLFAPALPPAFQGAVFWADIPPALGLVENGARTLAMVLTLYLPLSPATRREKQGFWIYGVGLALYLMAFLAQIVWPGSGWSTSAAGFVAPAVTPALWLFGIGLIGAGRDIRLNWAYGLAAAIFLAAHISHTLLVFSRL